jgi:predicted nucleic acid-binding protein
MQEKIVFDTNIYIGIFNKGLYSDEVNGFNRIMYLVHPVLHELWMGARGMAEIRHLLRLGNTFIKLGRLIQPLSATQVLIGRICNRLRSLGKLDPKNPRTYNDICIALLSRQVGATVVTRDIGDFEAIRQVIDFDFRDIVETLVPGPGYSTH